MAQSYMLALGHHRAQDVTACFTRYRSLIPSNLAVGPPKDLTAAGNTFQTLLSSMAAQGAANYMVVVHGYDDGTGLHLPLSPTNKIETKTETLKTLLDIQEAVLTPEKARGGLSDDKLNASVEAMMKKHRDADRTKLGMSPAQLRSMLTLMLRVQRTKIGWFEFRGCNLGKKSESIEVFRRFVGARHLGAPDLHTFYGQFDVRTGDNWMRTHAAHHKGTTHTFRQRFANPTGELLCCVGTNTKSKPVNGHIVADSPRTVNRWIRQQLSAGAGGSIRRLAIYGLWELVATVKSRDPNDPLAGSPTGKPGPIWPRSFWYRGHIKYSHG